MRINYGMRQVATQAKAESLVEQQGFSAWQAVKAAGNMAQPYERLAVLGQLDIQLSQATEAGRPYSAGEE